MDYNLILKITIYALKLSDQTISPEEFEELNSILSSDPKAARHYNFLMMSINNFRESGQEILCDDLSMDILSKTLWQELADYEKTAPDLKIPQKKPQNELIQKVVYPPREKRKLSKFSIFMLFNTAAMILLFLFLKYVPTTAGIEVATLTDSLQAKWADAAAPIEKGMRVVTGNERLLLTEGYVELLFDNHTRVTVEGPAEFQILTDDRIFLNYGKVYLTVPTEAIGFSVYTQNAKIIDLGTEFGVLAEIGGNTQLHVVKGKTMLMAGHAGKVNMEVSEGMAKKISDDTEVISDIEYRSGYFVRNINSESTLIWKGQKLLDLADIAGGGNGFGSGTIDMGIDPVTGKPSREFTGAQESANHYRLVPSNAYIDGVFIPNGRTQQVVSSQGHVFHECPATSGSCYNNISYGRRILESQGTQNTIGFVSPPLHNSLLMHANTGITYDLQSIRTLLPNLNIVRFQSKIRIEQGAMRPSLSNADFWVLVDGKLKFHQTQVKAEELFAIDLELSENDRFLTLVITDGNDPKERMFNNFAAAEIDSDWGMFADAVLVLE
jgi:hypothetical protein